MADINLVTNIKSMQAHVGHIYPNEKYSADYIFGYLARNAGYMCKKIWQDKSEPIDFIRTLSWIIGISNKFSVDVEQALVSRYPKACPYCLGSPCFCHRTNKRPERYLPSYKINEDLYFKSQIIINSPNKITLDFMANTIAEIYPNNEIIWLYSGPWRHLVKIQEEISEIHEAMSGVIKKTKPLDVLSEEVADAVAWVLSAWKIKFKDLSFDEEVKDYYYTGCPVCKAAPCTCPPRSERPGQLADISVIEDLQRDFNEIVRELGIQNAAIEEIRQSLEAARTHPGESTVKRAMLETRNGLDSITNAVDYVEKNTSKVAKLISNANKIIDMFSS